MTPAAETLPYERFLEEEQAWDELALATESPVPFMCHAWLRHWWRHFGNGQEFVVVAVRGGETLLAAVPLAIRRGNFGMTVAEIVGTGPSPTRGMGLSDKADLLVRQDKPEAAAALVAGLRRLLERVDLIDIKGVDAAGWLPQALAADAPRTFVRSVSPYLELKGSWDEYRGTRSRNFRKHLKKYWRLLENAGRLEVTRLGERDNGSAWMEEVFAVNGASWKAERGTNLFRSPATRRFFADLVPDMARRGYIDLHMVRIDGRAVVYELCFDFGNRLFSYNGAYRADLPGGSPGTALTATVIESAYERGRSEYDMLRGAEEYKLRWSETQRSESQLMLTAAGAGAQLKTALGPALKARLKQWGWLNEHADRLSGFLTRLRHR